MDIKKRKGILPIFIALIVIGSLGLGAGGYEGVHFYQSQKLVRQGDQLMKDRHFAEALLAYEKAGKKFGPMKKKTAEKVTQAQGFIKDEGNLNSGMESFGKGEWQKCLDYLGQVTAKSPSYKTSQEKYSDCQKKLAAEQQAATEAAAAAAAQAAAAQTAANTATAKTNSTGSSTSSKSKSNTKSSGSSSSSSGGSTSSGSQTHARPALHLPFSIMPPRISPMGETLYHGAPMGHPGIDFIWTNTEGDVPIIASLDATVTAIRASNAHAGAYDVTTQSDIYGVDYTEMGSVKPGLAVGNTVKVGDLVGYAYHPSEFTDSPNYKMIHWQFGYEAEHPEYSQGVANRLCPMTYFTASAKSTIDNLWATTDWNGVDMKGNAPNICSGYYAGRDS